MYLVCFHNYWQVHLHTPRLAVPGRALIVDRGVVQNSNSRRNTGGADSADRNRLLVHCGLLRVLSPHGLLDEVANALLVVADLQDDVFGGLSVYEDGPVAGVPLVRGVINRDIDCDSGRRRGRLGGRAGSLGALRGRRSPRGSRHFGKGLY